MTTSYKATSCCIKMSPKSNINDLLSWIMSQTNDLSSHYSGTCPTEDLPCGQWLASAPCGEPDEDALVHALHRILHSLSCQADSAPYFYSTCEHILSYLYLSGQSLQLPHCFQSGLVHNGATKRRRQRHRRSITRNSDLQRAQKAS